jgi:hypothetical protein
VDAQSIDNNRDANIIVGTHDFIDWNNVPTSDWGWEFSDILDQYPNVFLTLNGHNTLEGYPCSSHTTVGNRTEAFFNLQEEYDYLGAATARIFEFSLSTKTVQALTYQVFNNQWVTNSDYQFSFSFPFIQQQTTWRLTTNVNPQGAGTTTQAEPHRYWPSKCNSLPERGLCFFLVGPSTALQSQTTPQESPPKPPIPTTPHGLF